MSPKIKDLLTTAEAAREITESHGPPSIEEWQVRRLFEDGILPEPPRFGQKRVILRVALPSIVEALRKRGWLWSTRPSELDYGAITAPADTEAVAS
jgi:hypothetical protein